MTDEAKENGSRAMDETQLPTGLEGMDSDPENNIRYYGIDPAKKDEPKEIWPEVPNAEKGRIAPDYPNPPGLPEMHSFIGTKRVKAAPMLRGEYNNYRDWDIPQDEDPADPGFLVEYLDSPNSNHLNHENYISWSPADVFISAYARTDVPVVFQAELTGHQVNPCNDKLRVLVMDKVGSGGAHHHYRITGFEKVPPTRAEIPADPGAADVIFQNGPIAENGVNGLTQEALLEIVEHRLACFDQGPFASVENRRALRYVRKAKAMLQARTRERMARGVEGTHQK